MFHDVSMTPRQMGDSFCGPPGGGNFAFPVGGGNYMPFHLFQDFSGWMNLLPGHDVTGNPFDGSFLQSPTASNKPVKTTHFDYGVPLTFNTGGPSRVHTRRRDEINMPQEERDKRDKRRQRNKEAAARCRQRRLDLLDELTERVETFRRDNELKNRELEQIKKEADSLLAVVKNHFGHLSVSEKEALERVTSEIGKRDTLGFFPPEAMNNIGEEPNMNMTLAQVSGAAPDCLSRPTFLDLVSPKHGTALGTPGHFAGMPTFSSLPSMGEMTMNDYMFLNLNQAPLSHGPNAAVVMDPPILES